MSKFKYVKLKHTTDTWLSPPQLISSLGKFDLDPCCPHKMPWRTAKVMIHFPEQDGLKIKWFSRVWCNPPYSNMRPWVEKMLEHKNGILLAPAKSTDSRWGQACLKADAVLFLSGRLLFHYIDGEKSSGKWLPNMLCAFGRENVLALKNIKAKYPGTLMTEVK